MDSESPLPAKRLRGSLNGNLQLTECIREFKLPRQFPSMATKLNGSEVNNEKRMRANYQTAVAVLPKTAYTTKIVQNKDIIVPNLMRKIKLKGKDGRDLGEVNVQDLPQNIQGKTICLAKNGIKKQPEVLPITDKSKGITIGVLTPVDVLNSDGPIVYPAEKNIPSLTCVTKPENNKFVDIVQEQDSKKMVIVEQKKMSAVMDPQGRPQVLVFQSGKNWHMVKIASSAPPTVGQASQSKKNIVVGKWPQASPCGKITIAGGQNQSLSQTENSQNGAEISSTVANKVSTGNNTSMVVRRWSQSRTPDSTTDRCKSKSPANLESTETSKPKIEISRIFGPSNGKQISLLQTKLLTENGRVPSASNDSSSQKNTNLRQDVMVVLPSNSPVSLENESTNGNAEVCTKAPSTSTNSGGSSWRRKLSANSKNGEGSKYLGARDLLAKKSDKKSVENGERKEENSNLSILEKALSCVEDEDLRAKALKALAECGIGFERLVPIRPVSEQKAVKDSDTQTSVFGLWDSDDFIYVSKDSPGIERKRAIERQPHNVAHIVGNAHSQDLTLNGFETPKCSSPMDPMLSDWIGEWIKDNEAVAQVQNMLTKPNLHPVRSEVVEQLEEDFRTHKEYDEEGLLNIHKAVLANQPRAVLRHLKVLKACRVNVDLPTVEGQTSLELAVRCKVSPTIVKLLLEHGAQPTCDEAVHDSALIIASKKSLPIITELIPRASPRKSLDNYDSSGFAALHHCAQNGWEAGVKALIQASANVDLRDRRSGRTALFHAVENEHMDLAQMLLDNGAQSNISNYSGQTVVNLIDDNKHYNLAETLNRLAK